MIRLFCFCCFFVLGMPLIAQTSTASLDSAEWLIYENQSLNRVQQILQPFTNLESPKETTSLTLKGQILRAALAARQEQFEQSIERSSMVAQTYPELLEADSLLLGQLYQVQAWAHWGLAQYELAYEKATLAMDLLRATQHWSRLASASLMATYAIYYNEEAEFGQVQAHIDTTLAIAQRHLQPNQLIFMYIYQLHGAILYQQGHIRRALQMSRKGVQLQHQRLQRTSNRKDSILLAQAYANLGRMYKENNDLEPAITHYNNAILLEKKTQNYTPLLKLFVRLANLYEQSEQNKEAATCFQQLKYYLDLAPNHPKTQQSAHIFRHLSIFYYYQHFQEYDSILYYYNKHLPDIKQYQLGLNKAYLNIGWVHQKKGNYKEAEQAYQKALRLEQKKYGQRGIKVARSYLKLGNLAKLQNKPQLAKRYADSILYMLEALAADGKSLVKDLSFIEDRVIVLKAWHLKASILHEEKAYEAAQEAFDAVISLHQYLQQDYTVSSSKLQSVGNLRPIYEAAAVNAWELYQIKQDPSYVQLIFDYSEQSKASLLEEYVAKFRHQHVQQHLGIPTALLEQEEGYLAQIAQCKTQIREATRQKNAAAKAKALQRLLRLQESLEQLAQNLKKEYPSYHSWQQHQRATCSLDKVQAQLNNNEQLLEYFITDTYLFIFSISKEVVSLKIAPKYDAEAFRSNLRQFRQLVSNTKAISQQTADNYRLFCAQSWQLYQQLLAAQRLPNKTQLSIIPDQALNYLPFEALLTAEVPPDDYMAFHTLPYLIRDQAVNYRLSASLGIHIPTIVQQEQSKMLAFAATYSDLPTWKNLPTAAQRTRTLEEWAWHKNAQPIEGTLEELQALEQAFKGQFFKDQQATEGQFKAALAEQQYGIVHLAMHGMVNYQQPSRSALLFTENLDSLEDNLLYLDEARFLDGQGINLLVLSACKTGEGKYAKGEGIISLGRGFIQAGVPSIVMTLWELSDQAGAVLMPSFYEALAEGKSKHEALQAAKLAYLDSHTGLSAHPFFWASLVLIGDEQAIPLEIQNTTSYWWYLLGGVLLIWMGLIWRHYRRTRN